MKTKFLFVLMLFLATTLGTAVAQNAPGTWKMIESSGNKAPEGYTQLKMMTDTHFLWMTADAEGNIISGAGGTYTFKDGVYTETITYVLPGMKPFKGKKASYKVTMKGKRASLDGYLELDKSGKFENKEVWEKID